MTNWVGFYMGLLGTGGIAGELWLVVFLRDWYNIDNLGLLGIVETFCGCLVGSRVCLFVGGCLVWVLVLLICGWCFGFCILGLV